MRRFRFVASTVRNVVSTVVVFGVALLVGLRPHARALDWLAAAGIVLAYITAISWFAAAVGLVARSPEGADAVTFFVMFLPYASSAFVPVATMPSWLHGFANNQPVTPITDTLRALLAGSPVGHQVWPALAWCVAIGAVSVAPAGPLFRRRAR